MAEPDSLLESGEEGFPLAALQAVSLSGHALRYAQNTYRDEQLNPIVDMFVSAFANSTKAIKDGYDNQIKQYDHMLNGYTKETANGKKHFFGAAEICQMFEYATPKLLRKFAGVIAEHGCKDVKEWMQKSPWYREFELGRDVERKLQRERGWRDKTFIDWYIQKSKNS